MSHKHKHSKHDSGSDSDSDSGDDRKSKSKSKSKHRDDDDDSGDERKYKHQDKDQDKHQDKDQDKHQEKTSSYSEHGKKGKKHRTHEEDEQRKHKLNEEGKKQEINPDEIKMHNQRKHEAPHTPNLSSYRGLQRDLCLDRGGKKKSLLIGINYKGQESELRGCINDVNNVKEFLTQAVGFPSDPASMTILTEEPPAAPPTKKNMIAAMQWLVSATSPGDSLFLHYSGHGSRVPDTDGDREDGMDDTIVPLDYKAAGQITSDDLHHILVDGLPKGVRLTAVFDCCHSGTALELPYTFRSDENGNVKRFNLLGEGKHLLDESMKLLKSDANLVDKLKGAGALYGGFKNIYDNVKSPQGLAHGFLSQLSGGAGGGDGGAPQGGGQQQGELYHETCMKDSEEKEVFLFSGCKDDQTSADAMIQGIGNGAMSFAIMSTLKANSKQSYKQILLSTREFMVGKYSQIPQLSVGSHDAPLDSAIQF